MPSERGLRFSYSIDIPSRMFTRRELLTLAEALSGYTGMQLSTLGTRIVGNDKLFIGIAEGRDCLMAPAEKASEYFDGCWPVDLPWPRSVGNRRLPNGGRAQPKRPSPTARARATGKAGQPPKARNGRPVRAAT